MCSDYCAARRALGVVPQELVFDPFLPCASRWCFSRAILA